MGDKMNYFPPSRRHECVNRHQCTLYIYVCCCCSPSETYGRKWVTPIFRSLQNCQFHHRRLESLEHFNVLYIYHSEHYGLSFLDLTDVFFLQGLPFCIHFHFCKYTLHVCYVFNVNLTDSFDDRRSQCCLI